MGLCPDCLTKVGKQSQRPLCCLEGQGPLEQEIGECRLQERALRGALGSDPSNSAFLRRASNGQLLPRPCQCQWTDRRHVGFIIGPRATRVKSLSGKENSTHVERRLARDEHHVMHRTFMLPGEGSEVID